MNYLNGFKNFDIVDKTGQTIPFIPNKPQEQFLDDMSGKDVILKARQIGFSSLILGIFTLDFLLVENSRSVCISHDATSATKLLDRVRFYIKSAEEKGLQVNLKYNSRVELVNQDKNSTFYLGQAGSKSFGRGDTLNNLHLSEFAFYEDQERLLAGILQAVVPNGRVIIESTANGMNYYKKFWDDSKAGLKGFKTHFYDNSFYSDQFLAQKRMELGDELFKQEYPATDIEAFLSSGNPFFDREALKHYLDSIQEPFQTYNTYHDLLI